MVSPPATGRLLDGAGNRFVLIDALTGDAPEDLGVLAREMCAGDVRPGFRPDGLLLVHRDEVGAVRMVIRNRDGSRAAMCGNGLRCLAWYLVDAGHLPVGEIPIETDDGIKHTRVERSGGVLSAEVELGHARIGEALATSVAGRHFRGVAVDLGNPHYVAPCDDVGAEPLRELGTFLQEHAAFPRGVNVELVSPVGPNAFRMRVFERGVGETLACGTGAGAAAAALVERGAARYPVTMEAPGGTLVISERSRSSWLAGPVVDHGPAVDQG